MDISRETELKVSSRLSVHTYHFSYTCEVFLPIHERALQILLTNQFRCLQTGREFFDKWIKRNHKDILRSDHPSSILVQKVAERIVSASNLGHAKMFCKLEEDVEEDDSDVNLPTFQSISNESSVDADEVWEVIVVDQESPNAWVAPGEYCTTGSGGIYLQCLY